MNKHRYSLLLILTQFCFAQNLSSQNVSGKVFSESLNPLAGVSIYTSKYSYEPSTRTDHEGNYSITIDSNHRTLVYSYGSQFESQEVKINKDTIVNITLKRAPIELDEIFIKAIYFNSKKRFNPSTLLDTAFYRLESERKRKILDSIDLHHINDSINFSREINQYGLVRFKNIKRTFSKYIVDSIEYSQKAVDNHIQGTVYALFTINDDNKITDVMIIRSLTSVLDDEVTSILEQMPEEIQKEFGEMAFYYERRRHFKYLLKINFTLIDI